MKTGRKKAALFAGLFLSLLWMIQPVPALAEAGPVTSIGSPEALDAFAQSVCSGQTYAGRTVCLTADIDMSGRAFTAIGVTAGDDFSRVFQGTFDGGGHAITGLTVTAAPGSDSVGFFSGLYNAAVRDLTLELSLAADGLAAAGGLAGRTVNAAVGRADVTVDVTAADWPAVTGQPLAAGGLIGLADGRTAVDRCAVRGRLGAAGSFTGSVYAGGLIGCLRSGGADGRVTNCYATAGLYVNDRAVYVGGLAGGFLADGGYTVVQNCYAAASMLIAGDHMAGGFFGAADGSVMAQNTWYDADLAAGLPNGGSGTLAGLRGAHTAQMQSRGFPDVLGDAFAPDSQGVNGGYPVLAYQAPAEPTDAPLPTSPPIPTETPAVPTEEPVPPSTPTPTAFAGPTAVPPLPTSPPIPSAGPAAGPGAGVPKTGDSTALLPWLALLCAAAAALAWLARRAR